MPDLNLNYNQLEKIAGMTTEYPFVMNITNLANYADHTIPWHWHEELELCYVRKGSLRIFTNNAKYDINAGEGFFINTNVMNMKISTAKRGRTTEVALIFHPIFLSGNFHSIFETKYLNPILKNRHLEVVRLTEETESGKAMLSILKRIEELQAESNTEFATRNLLSEAWLLLIREVLEHPEGKSRPSLRSQDRLQYMIAYIHRHYREKITLEDIAASASISAREASRTFRKIRDKSPVDYLIEYRLSKAGNELLSTDDSITDIAFRNGFENSSYFGKIFRKHFNMTPSEFRKKAGSADESEEPELEEIMQAASIVSQENEKIETAAGRM